MSQVAVAPGLLPELADVMLDEQTLVQLFDDIETYTRVFAVIPKFAKQGHVAPKTISLREGQILLAEGDVRGIQLRYLYEDGEWWDTLMKTPNGVRLVRIEHEVS